MRDAKLELSTAKNIFGDDATVAGENVIDLAGVDPAIGDGRQVYLSAKITTAFAGGTSANFILHDSADNSSFAATSPVIQSGVITTANLGVNTLVLDRVPIHGTRRYIRLDCTSVGTHTAGAIDAWLEVD